ncbi:MAG: carbon monoxide dehydrogenase, partial [Anaerolineae bacterium]|nr:carbon monoxide dehydrogenase [Anaerolineae bacterium]
TGARPGEFGGYFRLNPQVDDIPKRFSVEYRGIYLMQMGTIRGAGKGCACPENAMLKALMSHLLLREKETVILDMVAGLEHLGRGTAQAVDAMYIVVEPGKRSLDIAQEIAQMATQLGIPHMWAVANKVRGEEDLLFMREHLKTLELIGWLPYDPRAIEADMRGQPLYDVSAALVDRVREIARQTGLL